MTYDKTFVNFFALYDDVYYSFFYLSSCYYHENFSPLTVLVRCVNEFLDLHSALNQKSIDTTCTLGLILAFPPRNLPSGTTASHALDKFPNFLTGVQNIL